MDRSYLSRPEVIAASRRFVCVRLTTYEDAGETAFLKSFGATGSGEVENTLFTILSPDGQHELTGASRSPRHNFDDAKEMAAAMNRIAGQFEARAPSNPITPGLPTVGNVRLAINVAACDHLPLVVIYAETSAGRKALTGRLRPLAWDDRFLGRFVYVLASTRGELQPIVGARPEEGIILVEPDRFGLKGTASRQLGSGASQADLTAMLEQAATLVHRPDSFRAHVREGRQQGAFWKTAVPVTDPWERQARERLWGTDGRQP